MKNSILKSFTKKILKSEAFVSVIIVFVLAIGIIGTSYALYMDVDTDTNYQLINVGDLSIGFDNGDNTIDLVNMTPTEDDIAVKQSDNVFSFYIYNTGSYTTDYDIKLETVEGNTIDVNYINYQICQDNATNCEDIKTLGNITDKIVYKDQLAPKKDNDQTNPSVYYFLRVWVNNKYVNTDNNTVKLKVIIEARNANSELDNKNTLVGNIMNNSTINNIVLNSSDIEIENKGLYKINDDYGVSYIYRGNVDNNYVSFANKLWRIVRINGDKSVRIILNESIGDSMFNINSNDNSFVGYMFNQSSDNYLDTHNNINSSTIKILLDNYYVNNLSNYESYIVDNMFCSDKALVNDSLGYGNNNSYYGAFKRLVSDESVIPKIECAKGIDNNYSRFTNNNTHTSKSIETNNNLEYPIGLITADEVVLAGGYYNKDNTNYYLNNTWTMTPASFIDNNANVFSVSNTGKIEGSIVNTNIGVRPVINIKSNVLLSGNGTQDNPYVLK